jgi:ribosome maturation factor RimP
VIEQRIEALLQEKLQEEAFQNCFLIEIKLHPNNKLDIFIDCDTGVTFETCHKLSRYLEEHIDTEGWLGEKYVLEVSSPGIGRPLKLRRQYPRNLGRTLEVHRTNQEKHKGKLVLVEDEQITLEEQKTEKQGKKKKKITVQTVIPFAEIKKAVVKASFK